MIMTIKIIVIKKNNKMICLIDCILTGDGIERNLELFEE